jgi:small subunit ribosomal protein S9
MAKVYATGKRKTAVAKVWLEVGKGEIIVNGQDLNVWLGGHEALKLRVMQPLNITKQAESVDIVAKTLGGGYSAQADAVRHGITKALINFDEAFRKIVKPHGLITRDARKVERKKYGKKKARRSPQFSKR